MRDLVAVYLFICTLNQLENTYAGVEVPFTHDFSTGLHGWNVGYWNWAANSNRNPDITNIPSFHSSANYIWTQENFDSTLSIHSSRDISHKTLYYKFVSGVTKETKFHVNYWFHANKADCGFLVVYLLDHQAKRRHPSRLRSITHNSSNWNEVTFDCQSVSCCDHYNCDLSIVIFGSAGKSKGKGLIAINKVSTTKTNTTNGKSISKTYTAALVMSSLSLVILILILIALIILRYCYRTS